MNIYTEVLEDILAMKQTEQDKGYLTDAEAKKLNHFLNSLTYEGNLPQREDEFDNLLSAPSYLGARNVAKSEHYSNAASALSFTGKIRGAALDLKLRVRDAFLNK